MIIQLWLNKITSAKEYILGLASQYQLSIIILKNWDNSRKLASGRPKKVTAYESRAIAQYLQDCLQEIWQLN